MGSGSSSAGEREHSPYVAKTSALKHAVRRALVFLGFPRSIDNRGGSCSAIQVRASLPSARAQPYCGHLHDGGRQGFLFFKTTPNPPRGGRQQFRACNAGAPAHAAQVGRRMATNARHWVGAPPPHQEEQPRHGEGLFFPPPKSPPPGRGGGGGGREGRTFPVAPHHDIETAEQRNNPFTSFSTCGGGGVEKSDHGPPGRPRGGKYIASVHVQFLRDVLTADLDFAFVLAGCREVIGKLHPQPRLLRAAERLR